MYKNFCASFRCVGQSRSSSVSQGHLLSVKVIFCQSRSSSVSQGHLLSSRYPSLLLSCFSCSHLQNSVLLVAMFFSTYTNYLTALAVVTLSTTSIPNNSINSLVFLSSFRFTSHFALTIPFLVLIIAISLSVQKEVFYTALIAWLIFFIGGENLLPSKLPHILLNVNHPFLILVVGCLKAYRHLVYWQEKSVHYFTPYT